MSFFEEPKYGIKGVEENKAYDYRRPRSKPNSKLAQMMINFGLSKNEKMAEFIFAVVAIIFFILAVIIFFKSSTPSNIPNPGGDVSQPLAKPANTTK